MKKLFQPSQLIITYWEDEDICTASIVSDAELEDKDPYGEWY